MKGTQKQKDTAVKILSKVTAEFDRIGLALKAAAERAAQDQRDLKSVLKLLEEKRAEVMACQDADYVITEWREVNGKVRRILEADPRYQAIKSSRTKTARPS